MATKQKKLEVIQARINPENKLIIARAAKLREVPVSDYMRTVLLSQARKEVSGDENQVLQLTAEEQLKFWNALDNPQSLTPAQKGLGKLMHGG